MFCVRATEWHLALGEHDTKKITEQVLKILILLQRYILKFHSIAVTNSYLHGYKKYIYISCVLWLISFKRLPEYGWNLQAPLSGNALIYQFYILVSVIYVPQRLRHRILKIAIKLLSGFFLTSNIKIEISEINPLQKNRAGVIRRYSPTERLNKR